MISRRALSTAACALACVAAIPAAASAAQIDVKPTYRPVSELAQRNGVVYAIQASDGNVTSFDMATGAQRRDGFAVYGSPLEGSAVGPRGLYLGVASDSTSLVDDRGYAILDDGPDPVHVSLASSVDCGPKALAWDADIQRMLFYTCNRGTITGGGMTDADGGHVTITDPGEQADRMFYAKGNLWTTDGSRLRRYTVTADAWTLQSETYVNGAIDGMALGPDGQLWMANPFSGEITEMPVDGSAAPKLVVSGLDRPESIGTDPDTAAMIAVLGHGTAAWVGTRAGLVRIDPITHKTATVPLPDGALPAGVEVHGNDVWTNEGGPGVPSAIVHVVASSPYAGEVSLNGLTATATFTPNGEDTHAQLLVEGPEPSTALQAIDLGTVPGAGGPKTLSASLASLAPGTYSLVAHADNAFGSAEGVVHPSFTVPAPAPPPAPPVATPAKAIKKPKLADLVSLASAKRCVATRTLRLTLHKRAKGAATVTQLKLAVGHGKTKTYNSAKLRHGLKLTGLPRSGRYALRLTLRLSDGTTVKQTINYTACRAKAKAKHK